MMNLWSSRSVHSEGGFNYFVGGTIFIPGQSLDSESIKDISRVETHQNIVCLTKNSYDKITSHISCGINWNGLASIRILGPGQARRKWVAGNSNTKPPGSDCHINTKETLVGSYSHDGNYTFLLDSVPEDWKDLVEVSQLEQAIRDWLSSLVTAESESQSTRNIQIVMTHDFMNSSTVPIHFDDDEVNYMHPCNSIRAEIENSSPPSCFRGWTCSCPHQETNGKRKISSMVPLMIYWILREFELPTQIISSVKSTQVWMNRMLPQIPEKTYPFALQCRPGEISLSQDGWTIDDGRLLTPHHILITVEKDSGASVSKPSIFSDGRVEFAVTSSSYQKTPVKVFIRAIFTSKDCISHHLEIVGPHLSTSDPESDIMNMSRHSLDQARAPESPDSSHYLHRISYVNQYIIEGFVNAKNQEKKISEASQADKETILMSSSGPNNPNEFIFVPNKISQYLKEVKDSKKKCDPITKQFFEELVSISIEIRRFWFDTLSSFHPVRSYLYHTARVEEPQPSMMRQVSSFGGFY